jgi:uracil-DNA glycosylase
MSTLTKRMRALLHDWRADLSPAWARLLADVEPDFDAIDDSLEIEDSELVFPGRKSVSLKDAPSGAHIFRALDGIEPTDVRVIVIGQDPYPRVSRATGRAFEQGDIKSWSGASSQYSPSLKRILQQAAAQRTGSSVYQRTKGGWPALAKHLKRELRPFGEATPTFLFDHWQKQGLLLLNTGLTLSRYKPGGHPHQLRGHIPLWRPVVKHLCYSLAERKDVPVVFLVWGGEAKRFLIAASIARKRKGNLEVQTGFSTCDIVERSHPAIPSFLAGTNVFAETNQKLQLLGADPVAW